MAEVPEDAPEEGKKKGKLMIIIIAVVVLLGAGAGAFFLLGGEEPPPMMEGGAMPADGAPAAPAENVSVEKGTAMYVQMPRPFTFNVPGTSRGRVVEIRVQLMVRGIENEELAKLHIPSIEGALVSAFSSSNADDLVTEAGKVALRDQALRDVKSTMKDITGSEVVEKVLFTGFVMQ
ncbi:flagellar basal body-associated protein FliL [Bowmanella sp. JS7-9]|uniref:Flagellar protein FliL n=1 Tax=Pseudobowmanella zhangzhouensis TaxID=1537679 RepID=A0ABW1XHV3_9ALTE|nr:flagellar basal body-associated protein FliL [Bowmanella sp. JS7-9]TBX25852.1 flagellar basal body-associated protein FliL [Bowmanella sp. JS7-9]